MTNKSAGVPDKRKLEAFSRECREIGDALKREYGEVRHLHGVPYTDFAKHTYVGRAGALLLQASAIASGIAASAEPSINRYQSTDSTDKAEPS